ncbi:restriction endonuclease subunit S [Glaesserella parasuis]|nr:restriction endonuclease subunit S [Glaesserella parasuis]MDE3959144.1 restriction endonuclease subunit S [Glaesserella parasuis]
MSSWKEYKLGEIATFYNGRAYKNTEFKVSGTPIVRIQNLTGEGKIVYSDLNLDENKYIDYGDLIYAWSATFGPYIWKGEKSIYHYHIWKIICNEELLDKKYFYYKLKQISDNLKDSGGNGSIFVHITKAFMENFKVKIPSLNEQKRVSSILAYLDEKIQLNTQINQTLEQIAQTIFKSWFIDFDPVHAKANALASGQTLEQATQAAMAVISGKNTQELHRLQTANPEQYQQLWEIADAFPSGFDEEGVPWGWESKKVGEVAKIVKGKSYKSSELAPSKTALVTLKSFNRGGGYRLDGLKEYTGNYKEEQEVFAGDLIIAYTDVTQAADVIGKPAMVMSDSCYEHLVISLDVGVVRPKNEKHKYFLYCLAMTDTFQAHTHSFCTGTTVLHLGKDAVPSFEFILPDNKFIELFDEFVLPIFVRINNIIEENKSLEKIRDELLPKLLSGEILNGN